MIQINLEKLLLPEAVAKIKHAGLHKLAAEMARNEGFSTSDDFDLEDAVKILGTKLRIKNAEYATIAEGLEALKNLDK